MITNIKMKDCATYDKDIGESLSNCQKVNFIYGSNGSGKSTISNFLMDRDNPRYKKCSVIENGSRDTEICVYNKTFREQHFKAGVIPGVFTLGKAAIEDVETLNSNKKKVSELQCLNEKLEKTKLNKQEEIDIYEATFKNNMWNSILKKYEDDFKDAFSGLRRSKDKFILEAKHRINTVEVNVYSREDLLKRADTLFKSKLESCQLIEHNINENIDQINVLFEDNIWKLAIVGSSDVEVGKLINKMNNSDWVMKGRKYLADDSDICPFCQKHTIDNEFRTQLTSFFDKEYEQKVLQIKNLSNSFKENKNIILEAFKNIVSVSKNIDIGKIDATKYTTKIQILEQKFIEIENIMNKKYNEPARKVTFPDCFGLISELIDAVYEANQKINNHNQLVKDSSIEKSKLIDDIWKYCIFQNKILIDEYKKSISGLKKCLKNIDKQYKERDKRINDLLELIIILEKNITSVQPTVNEINRLLKSFGFTNFKIMQFPEQENAYQIEREDGTPVTNTLSEGEETFISFLYFMQFTKGATNVERVSKKKIIVIDDPICSLDSTVLYIVSAMVKSLSKDVRNGKSDVAQLFIFTHNVFFHKEASFIDGRTSELHDVNYWIIRKDNNVSKICSYKMRNPILTSYELLWKELKDNKTTNLISVQNNMRRIIENYFRLLGNKKDSKIIEKFETVEDQVVCKSLISWINDGSHSIPDDLYIDSYTDAVPKYKEIFRQIFVKTDNEAHYNMMMGLS